MANMDDAPAARGIELRFLLAAAKYWMALTSMSTCICLDAVTRQVSTSGNPHDSLIKTQKQ